MNAQTRVEIPDTIAEIAKRTLAKVPEADAIVLFGSRARGDAHETSDWDLMVRSHAMLAHNIMVLEGIIPEDGYIAGLGYIQSVSLSDDEAKDHTGEDDSLAVAWSREGKVIAGTDSLIRHARKKRLKMNDTKVLEMNDQAVREIASAWNNIVICYREGAKPEEAREAAPGVARACEMVAKLTMHSHGILRKRDHDLDRLAAQLRQERANAQAREDADTIASMNGGIQNTRMTMDGMTSFPPEQRASVTHDMRWEKTAERWATLLYLHARTLEKLEGEEGPAGSAASEAARRTASITRHMTAQAAQAAQRIPTEALNAVKIWTTTIIDLERHDRAADSRHCTETRTRTRATVEEKQEKHCAEATSNEHCASQNTGHQRTCRQHRKRNRSSKRASDGRTTAGRTSTRSERSCAPNAGTQ